MRAGQPIGSFSGSMPTQRTDWFGRLAAETAIIMGKPTTFLLAVLIVLVWAITGPIFHYSDTWQLVINTGTTIVTFLMVFLIQATQNRDTLALIKLSPAGLTPNVLQNLLCRRFVRHGFLFHLRSLRLR